MNLSKFLNKKLLEWQAREGERKTLDQFAELLGVKRSILSMWLNGTRNPGLENKKRLIELYGDEAAEALGEDPRLFFINSHWDDASDTLQRAVFEQLQKGIAKNDAQRLAKRTEKRNH